MVVFASGLRSSGSGLRHTTRHTVARCPAERNFLISKTAIAHDIASRMHGCACLPGRQYICRKGGPGACLKDTSPATHALMEHNNKHNAATSTTAVQGTEGALQLVQFLPLPAANSVLFAPTTYTPYTLNTTTLKTNITRNPVSKK